MQKFTYLRGQALSIAPIVFHKVWPEVLLPPVLGVQVSEYFEVCPAESMNPRPAEGVVVTVGFPAHRDVRVIFRGQAPEGSQKIRWDLEQAVIYDEQDLVACFGRDQIRDL